MTSMGSSRDPGILGEWGPNWWAQPFGGPASVQQLDGEFPGAKCGLGVRVVLSFLSVSALRQGGANDLPKANRELAVVRV